MNPISDAYIEACWLELEALKPGNVHRHAEGHGMTCRDFEISAKVSAPWLTRRGAPIGDRIYDAVTATKSAVGLNTNLGIVLLCAPLAMATERGQSLTQVLHTLTIGDTQKCFAAISAANPGGLGSSSAHDVHDLAMAPLREVMMAAANRDLVARQYATGFEDIVRHGLSRWAQVRGQGQSPSDAATAVYLSFLEKWPDTHIARKFGQRCAESLREEAEQHILTIPDAEPARQASLLAWDSDLKARGLNPGACADLTVATIFAAFLSERMPNVLRLLLNSD